MYWKYTKLLVKLRSQNPLSNFKIWATKISWNLLCLVMLLWVICPMVEAKVAILFCLLESQERLCWLGIVERLFVRFAKKKRQCTQKFLHVLAYNIITQFLVLEIEFSHWENGFHRKLEQTWKSYRSNFCKIIALPSPEEYCSRTMIWDNDAM